MEVKETRLANEPIGKLMISLSIPSIIAQLINILYSIVDRIYIGHIPGVGSSALTGVGLTLPILVLISAFSMFSSSGGAPLASIYLGKGNRKEAEKILGNSVWSLLFFSIILMVVFYMFYEPFLYMFGASKDTIPYAATYLKIYLAGTLFVELAMGLNTFIIVQGRPTIAMASILVGAVTNLVLDPIFIFVFGLGVKGAAFATIISQLISAVWNVSFLCGRRSTLRIKRRYIRCEKRIMKKILGLGISPFIMKATECLISIVMNRQLQIYGGDVYVGSMTIMQSIIQLVWAPISGVTQGVQPIISYNYGAGKFERVRKTYRIMIFICFIVGLAVTGITVLFPAQFAKMFTTDTELIELVAKVIPVFLFGMLFFGIQQGIQPTFLALGQAKLSIFVALLRKVILLVPLALILPNFFDVMGVYYAEPISDIISVITAIKLFSLNINKILSEEALERI